MAGVEKAISEGPYGRCVYKCDNDVVDHQVVNLLYENGATASFTMTAFHATSDRKTRIFGTKGQLTGDGIEIVHFDFLSDSTHRYNIETCPEMKGHGGGDYEIMKSFVSAVANNDPSKILSGPQESLETHLTVFAAEQARLNSTVVNL
jgi:predicted dehydrogenase